MATEIVEADSGSLWTEDLLEIPHIFSKENYKDVHYVSTLTFDQRQEAERLVQSANTSLLMNFEQPIGVNTKYF